MCQTPLDSCLSASTSGQQVAQSLYDHSAPKKIRQPCDVATVPDRVIKRLGKRTAHQNGKVGIQASFKGMTVAIGCDNLIILFSDKLSSFV